MANWRKITVSLTLVTLALFGGINKSIAEDNNSEKRSLLERVRDKVEEIIANSKKDSELPGDSEQGKGATRSSFICPIALFQDKTTLVFDKNPTFVWEGEAQRVMLRKENEDRDLGSKNVSVEDRIVLWKDLKAEEGLELGKVYHLVFYNGDYDSEPYPFMLVGGDRRQEIEAQLQILEKEIADMSVEEAALQRVGFFIERGLFVDAVALLYYPGNYDDELREEVLETLGEKLCGKAD
jgi:hypothetical protein